VGAPTIDITSSDGEWPAFFKVPAGCQCPPVDARDLDTEVFYLVSAFPATSEDFRCALQRGCFETKPHCLRAGLSCALSALALTKKQKRIPRLRSHQIASAQLSAKHGKYKQTTQDTDHHTMWLRSCALREAPTLFAVPGEVQ
jgi:hypothetical protein